jgi:hypothetical protein
VLQGPPLHLRESWQVEVVGSKIVRAGLLGAVKWAAPEAKALAGSTPFRLQVGSLTRAQRQRAALAVAGVQSESQGATGIVKQHPCACAGHTAHKHLL